jgi:lycopene cyclase domain-containing protein
MSAPLEQVRALGELGYFGWLAVLAVPVLGGQWLAFPGFLARTLGRWLPTAAWLAAWFMLVDAIGIAAGVWTIGDATTIGWRIAGVLPFEEALFFVLTTLMVTQTIALFLWRFGDLPDEPWRGWGRAFGFGGRARS